MSLVQFVMIDSSFSEVWNSFTLVWCCILSDCSWYQVCICNCTVNSSVNLGLHRSWLLCLIFFIKYDCRSSKRFRLDLFPRFICLLLTIASFRIPGLTIISHHNRTGKPCSRTSSHSCMLSLTHSWKSLSLATSSLIWNLGLLLGQHNQAMGPGT